MGCGGSKSAEAATPTARASAPEKAKAGSIGVIRLDYNYPPALGDIDHPGSFAYGVHYKVVPGLTFKMCQSGVMSPEVENRFLDAIKYFDDKGVTGITGDCGFMMYFQQLARRSTKKPVMMSALAQLPAVTCGFASNEQIAIFTANGESLRPMRELIRKECNVDTQEQRYVIVGCEKVPHFEAVARGERVPVDDVMPGMVKKAKEVIAANPNIRAILLECTELPPYSDALRKATGLPVYDAITACDFFLSGVQDNERFGIQDWQAVWDGAHDDYVFAKNLTEAERQMLVNKPPEERAAWMKGLGKPFAVTTETIGTIGSWLELESVWQAINTGLQQAPVRAKAGSLGVVRLDGDYPLPLPGDINHPASFAYEVFYKTVPGLTFEMCRSGVMSPEVEQGFDDAIKHLEGKGVSGITSDCSCMMVFQQLARRSTKKPVFMSALAQLPAVTCGFADNEQIAIFTAWGESLKQAHDFIADEFGIHMNNERYVIVGCEKVPHFEAVAQGRRALVDKVTPGMVAKAKEVLAANPNIRAILLESTECPPYSDALRKATGLPVYDAITACDFFLSGVQDNERFGIQDWQAVWKDGSDGQPTFLRRIKA